MENTIIGLDNHTLLFKCSPNDLKEGLKILERYTTKDNYKTIQVLWFKPNNITETYIFNNDLSKLVFNNIWIDTANISNKLR